MPRRSLVVLDMPLVIALVGLLFGLAGMAEKAPAAGALANPPLCVYRYSGPNSRDFWHSRAWRRGSLARTPRARPCDLDGHVRQSSGSVSTTSNGRSQRLSTDLDQRRPGQALCLRREAGSDDRAFCCADFRRVSQGVRFTGDPHSAGRERLARRASASQWPTFRPVGRARSSAWPTA